MPTAWAEDGRWFVQGKYGEFAPAVGSGPADPPGGGLGLRRPTRPGSGSAMLGPIPRR